MIVVHISLHTHASEQYYYISSFYYIQNRYVSNTAMISPVFVHFQSFYSKLKSIYLRCWESQLKSYLLENAVFSLSDLPLYYEIPYDR